MDCMKELRQTLWQQKIAIKIQLCKASNVKDTTSPIQYLMIYAQHYPLFYLQTIYDYFKQWINPALNSNQISLYYKNIRIPLNYPISVIVDLLTQKSKIQYVPLSFIIKFESEVQLQNLNEEIKNQFFFSLKLALIVKYPNKGLARLNQYLSDLETNTWFEQIISVGSRFETELQEIFQVYERVMDPKEAIEINLPLRIFVNGYPGRIQQQVNITNENMTIGQCLSTILPKIFVNMDQYIMFHGVELDQNIPALYFYNYLYSIDGFCYFAIV